MPKLSPQDAAAKWSSKASAAQGDYTAGIERTTADPGRAAAAKADKWFAEIQAARAKWAARVASVSAADWKQAAIQKGGPRYATGVQAAQGKYADFASEFFPHLDRVTQRVKSMPDTTLEQRLQRMLEQVRGTAQFKRRGTQPMGGGM